MERNVPKLRFKKFDSKWEKKHLSNIVERVVRKNKDNRTQRPLTISAQYGLVDQEEFFNKIVASKNLEGYYLLEKGEFAYNKSYSNGYPFGTIKRLDRYDNGAVSTLYICFNNKENYNSDYLVQYFESSKWHREVSMIAVEGARNHGLLNVSVPDFFDTIHRVPSLQEQERIANFLTKVDKIIEKQEEKVKNLENYKKGMMQKIFSQEIRFKDENGKEYPEWQEYKLNELCNFFSGGTPLTSKKEYYDGNIPFIRSAEISSENTELTISEIGLNNSSAKMIQKGDLLYALYGATSGEVSISKLNGAINQAILCIRSNRCNLIFLEKVLRNSKQNIIKTYLQGGQGNLSANIIKELQYNFPCLDEQDKIAKFITKIDIILQKEIDKLNELYKWKKGLLQQMFV